MLNSIKQNCVLLSSLWIWCCGWFGAVSLRWKPLTPFWFLSFVQMEDSHSFDLHKIFNFFSWVTGINVHRKIHNFYLNYFPADILYWTWILHDIDWKSLKVTMYHVGHSWIINAGFAATDFGDNINFGWNLIVRFKYLTITGAGICQRDYIFAPSHPPCQGWFQFYIT